MRKVQIVGGSFLGYSKSASLREDNKDVNPTYFEWQDVSPSLEGSVIDLSSPIFYCDGGLRRCTGVFEGKKIGWLVEPRHLHPENYEYAEKHQELFDVILTYDKELLDACSNARFYPLGGSSISFDKWGIYPKTRDVCMFVSSKRTTEGQKLRHEIVKKLKGRIDFYGAGVNRVVPSKFEVLKDYRYCVVVESGWSDCYFSEKLIDPLSVNTIPIYWGYERHPKGYYFDTLDILDYILTQDIKPDDNWYPVANHNFKFSNDHAICENWIYENYGDIFNG